MYSVHNHQTCYEKKNQEYNNTKRFYKRSSVDPVNKSQVNCIHIVTNKREIVTKGKMINPKKRTASRRRRGRNKIKAKSIMADFTAIPIPLENPTRPFLYSFFKGLKNVLSNKKTENTSKYTSLS